MNRRVLILTVLMSAASVPLIVSAQEVGVKNPLNGTVSNIPKFIETVLKIMVQVGLPIVAFFLLYAGFLFVSAGGNEGKISEARENFKYVIMGACLILGAWVIATLIGNTVAKVVGNS